MKGQAVVVASTPLGRAGWERTKTDVVVALRLFSCCCYLFQFGNGLRDEPRKSLMRSGMMVRRRYSTSITLPRLSVSSPYQSIGISVAQFLMSSMSISCALVSAGSKLFHPVTL